MRKTKNGEEGSLRISSTEYERVDPEQRTSFQFSGDAHPITVKELTGRTFHIEEKREVIYRVIDDRGMFFLGYYGHGRYGSREDAVAAMNTLNHWKAEYSDSLEAWKDKPVDYTKEKQFVSDLFAAPRGGENE